jgi:hypothetical protein
MALYDWVRGFLYAWGTLDLSGAQPSAETNEILSDFTDVTRMDLDRLDDSEQNEEALTEVSEFIRVAAMTIYQERVVARAFARVMTRGRVQATPSRPGQRDRPERHRDRSGRARGPCATATSIIRFARTATSSI